MSARIAFRDVSVEFPSKAGPIRVVDRVSYEIRDREFVSVIGPSGCGKTTTLNMAAGFVAPTAGQVLLDGKHVGLSTWVGYSSNVARMLTLAIIDEKVPFGVSIRGGVMLLCPHNVLPA